jgi:hypothetical protein
VDAMPAKTVPAFLSSSRERSERLDSALSRSNGLSGERVHDLERSTVNHVLKRRAELLTSSGLFGEQVLVLGRLAED